MTWEKHQRHTEQVLEVLWGAEFSLHVFSHYNVVYQSILLVRCAVPQDGVGYVTLFSNFRRYRRQFVLRKQQILGCNLWVFSLWPRYLYTAISSDISVICWLNPAILPYNKPIFLLGSFFLKYSEGGDSKLLRNLCNCIPVYTTSSLATGIFNTAVRTANLAQKFDRYVIEVQQIAKILLHQGKHSSFVQLRTVHL